MFVRVVVCVAYYNGGGCWLLLVMKRGLVLRGRWIVGWLIRGMKKEKPKSLPVFSPTAHCSSPHPGQTNETPSLPPESSKETRSRCRLRGGLLVSINVVRVDRSSRVVMVAFRSTMQCFSSGSN